MPSLDLIKPLPPIGPLEQVTESQLARYAELIYQRTGIRVSPQKRMLLSNRLRRRLRETGIKDFEGYYQHLGKLRPDDPEWDAFLQEITTHETYLFRDEAQWAWFSKSFLPQHAAEAAEVLGKRSLRIWSAACSTGDEPVTIACCVAASLPNLARWKVHVLGTDIGVTAIEQARSAVFGERAMRLVPEDYRVRFFQAVRPGLWQPRPQQTDMIAYRRHNLMQPLRDPPFDLAMVKNVLIYFDGASKKAVMDNVRAAIRPGGLLVAGAAEGLGELVKDFTRLQPWLYRRPLR